MATRLRTGFLLAISVATSLPHLIQTTHAGDQDWPQWRGPNRDGHAAPQSLLQEWPDGGPKVAWVFRNAGQGYSAFSVVDGRLYTMGSRGENCFVMCISADNGEQIWETAIGRTGNDQDYLTRWGGGPRSTPTVDGEYLYALSDVGVVACLRIADGTEVWSVDLVKDFGGSIPKWGYSESVLIDGDRAVVTAGGNSFLVGLNKATGETIWTSKDTDAGAQYVSVMTAEVGDKKVYVTAAAPGLFGIDASTGKQLFAEPATGNGTAVIPTPIIAGDLVYHTSAYGAGNAMWRLSANDDGVTAEPAYQHATQSMENHHGGVVLVDGVIYGFTKNNRGQWMAQDLESGETLWSESIGRNSSGSIAYADGRLYCYGDKDATVHLIVPNREGLKSVGSLALPEQTGINRGSGAIWAHPVIADQKLFLRDLDLIYAFDIAR